MYKCAFVKLLLEKNEFIYTWVIFRCQEIGVDNFLNTLELGKKEKWYQYAEGKFWMKLD